MRLQALALGVLLTGTVLLLGGCGGSESTASAAPSETPHVTTGDEAIAAFVGQAEPAVEAVDETAGSQAAETVVAQAAPEAAGTGLAQVAEARAAGGTPRIVVEEPIFNFGKMEVGEKRDHVWTIRNAGDVDLVISQVRASCGCTNTAMADDVIPPGGSSTLASTLDMPRMAGPVRKNIAISSNDPQQGTLIVAFVGEATQAIVVEPHVISFQSIDRNAHETRTAEVRATEDGLTFNILDLGLTPESAFDAELETIEDGRHYRVHLTTRPPLTGNHIAEHIRINTDNPRFEQLSFTAVATILTDIITAPEIIRLSTLHTDPLRRMILLRAGRVKDFNVTGVTLPDPEMSYTVTERQAGMLYIEINNILTRPDLDGKEVVITTDAPEVPEIRIPISVVGAGAEGT